MPTAEPAFPFTSEITLEINGHRHRLKVRHHWTLLDVLRDQLDLTGAKRGCDRGECGSCTVLLAGEPVYACQVLAMQVGGRPVVTIEGLAVEGHLEPVQRAFSENDGAQCGFCSPGFVLAARALLEANPEPTEEDIRLALAGNLCRCNAYGRIIQSVREVAGLKAAGPPQSGRQPGAGQVS